MSHQIKQIFNRSAEVKALMVQQCSGMAEDAAQMIAESLNAGGKFLLCGNGGSAGDAQHLAAEFMSCLDHKAHPRPGLAALALTTDTSFITAYANDFGFDGIFERQIETLGHAGDVLLCISTSGTSKNVVLAAHAGRAKGIKIISFTGEGGGDLAALSDVLIAVPSCITMHIQECHIAIGHAITARVETLCS
ncbi:MAG: SIS domain-containing protein [Alphaproteobacteria bacterium]|jgi:D-sedoheptulose 7-phosphate isomerase|nr:SIS domain-containing protein [Alphaproteobacteria bacterium]